ncbi:MAG: hypothetical protein QXV69_04515 [Sulfolobaceae archaeon]
MLTLLQVSPIQELQNILSQIIAAIPSIILFLIILLIGYAIASVVSYSIRSFLGRFFQRVHEQVSIDLVAGTVKAFIILIALAIALSVLQLGPATTYVQAIATYLPSLAGAILLLTLGITLVNVLVDFMQKAVPQISSEFYNTIISILRFGLYAVIITVAANLAIFYWIKVIDPYIFFGIILGSVVLFATFSIIETVMSVLQKNHPDLGFLIGYARFLLYTIFLLIGIAIIIQPLSNVTSIINTIAWGLAIAFAIGIIPLVVLLARKIYREAT